MLARLASASTITVNSTADTAADDGACTLREAITAANTNVPSGVTAGECVAGDASPTVDTIAFDIPGAGVQTITLASQLPDIVDPVTIDGYTQPGASANTLATGDDAVVLIKLDAASVTFQALRLCNPIGCGELGSSDGSTIRGLSIVADNHATFVFVASNDVLIEGNFIGVDTDGATVLGDTGQAVLTVHGISGTTIGGTSPAARNVIARNGSDLILADGDGLTVEGNYLAVNAAGTAALGSPARAINVEQGTGATIGGTAAGAGNVFGNWTIRAIQLGQACACTTADVVIQGNLVGTDATGTSGIADGAADVISVGRVANTTIGGSAAGAGNVITNPGGNGIVILGDSGGVSGVTIQGNKIGTDITGTSPLPNGACGIEISGFNGTAIGSIGGTGEGEGNVIAFNGTHGISIASFATGWAIEGNTIFGNGNLGITLGGDCGSANVSPTPNTAGGPHVGANDLQNFPVLDAPDFPGGASVSGSLNSTPGHSFRIEVFANEACDASLFGQGETFVGTVDTAPTDVNGDVAFTVSFGRTIGATALTATATDLATGDTSEFSACAVPPTTTTTTSTTTSSTTTTSTTSTTTATSTTATLSTTTATATSTTSTTARPTTTSTTSVPTTTSTTQPAGGCANEPVGPTFLSIDCRLDALIAEVGGTTDLGTVQSKLLDQLQKAKMHKQKAETLCRQANKRRTSNALRPAINEMVEFERTLRSKKARAASPDVTGALRAGADAIRADMRRLEQRLRCPDDAPPV